MKATSCIVGGLIVIVACILMQYRSEGFQDTPIVPDTIGMVPNPSDVSNGADVTTEGPQQPTGGAKGFDLSGNTVAPKPSKMLQFSMVDLSMVDMSGSVAPTITELPSGYQVNVPMPSPPPSTPISNGVYPDIQQRNMPLPVPTPSESPSISQGLQYNDSVPKMPPMQQMPDMEQMPPMQQMPDIQQMQKMLLDYKGGNGSVGS